MRTITRKSQNANRDFLTILFLTLAGASILFLAMHSYAHADVSVEELIKLLKQRYENLDTLKAHFTQSYQSKRFSDRISEKGLVYFRKGGLMKWDYLEPEPKTFISDGR